VWAALQPLMEGAIARTLDAAVIFGTSAPTTWATEGNLVADADAAGNEVFRGANAAAAGGVYGDLSDLAATLEADGYVPNGAVGNITFKARLRNARATTGEQLAGLADIPEIKFVPALAGLWPSGTSAAEVVMGDWSKLVVGVRQDMTYKLITEGVITDNSGNIVYNPRSRTWWLCASCSGPLTRSPTPSTTSRAQRAAATRSPSSARLRPDRRTDTWLTTSVRLLLVSSVHSDSSPGPSATPSPASPSTPSPLAMSW
jgi:hypothetical protein